MAKNEIEHLIEQLKELQLQQSDILARLAHLEKARSKESGENVGDPEENKVKASPNEVRPFAVGDLVCITNPNRALFQSDRGTISKIGGSRITVQTKNGKITRSPKNLILQR